jgi:trehalose-phosphatase
MLNGGLTPSWMNGRNVMPEYLSTSTHTILEKIDTSEETFLFLDYDGTLVSFKNRPQEVTTPKNVKTVLTSLLEHTRFKIFIISGRMLHEIKQLINIPGVSFAALHGLQIELSNGKTFFWEQAETIQSILKEIKQTVSSSFKNEKGIYIEDKQFTLAFHYRLVPRERIKEIVEEFTGIVRKNDPHKRLNLIHGAKVVEIRPKGWDKGKAVELILNHVANSENPLPIYIGDDTTDEDAFTQIKEKGITIVVANNKKKVASAKYWVKNPDEVLQFLKVVSLLVKES